MSKAFTKETDTADEDDESENDTLPKHIKNYMTPTGLQMLQNELRNLLHVERPKIVEIVSWAAGNGDRSENGDYIYGKKRLREIDKRVRYIRKRLDNAEIVDPERQKQLTKVFFGATVTYARADNSEHTVTLVGIDEIDVEKGKISWVSPLANALLKNGVGDVVELKTPSGTEMIEIISITYG